MSPRSFLALLRYPKLHNWDNFLTANPKSSPLCKQLALDFSSGRLLLTSPNLLIISIYVFFFLPVPYFYGRGGKITTFIVPPLFQYG